MSKQTVTTSLDAVTRILEDVVVGAGVAVSTWSATGSVSDTLTAVAASPLVKGAVAQALSGGRVSGVLAALKLVRSALSSADKVAAEAEVVLPSFSDEEIAAANVASGLPQG